MGAKKLSTIFRENLAKHGRLFPAASKEENETLIRNAGFSIPEEVIEWANQRHYTMKRYSNILFNFVEEYTTKILMEKVLDLIIARCGYYSFLSIIFKDGPISSSLGIESIKKLLEADGGSPMNIPDLALIAQNSKILNRKHFELDEIIDMNCYLLFTKDDMTTQIVNRRNYLIVRDAMREKKQ